MTIVCSCAPKNKIYIIKQWHLSPNQSTLDVNKSQQLPQFYNQKDIYLKAKKMIENGSQVIIAEGCEGEINDDFDLKFNGWGIKELKERKDLSDYPDILAPVPMKLKVLYGDKIKVLCGDNLGLIKKNNLAFSDTKAFSGFFQRLYYYKNIDTTAYEKYVKALANTVDLKSGDDPIVIAREKTLESITKFEHYISSRNAHFLKKIINNLKKNPILIIGGLHVPGLERELKKARLNYDIITPEDYPEDDFELLRQVKNTLAQYKEKTKLLFAQVPHGFDLSFLDYKKLLPQKSIATKEEWKQLEKIAKNYGFKPELLRLDMDSDKVRDFTLSTSPSQVIISSEDQDWDNDGVSNLADPSLFDQTLFKIQEATSPLDNRYGARGLDEKAILNFFAEKKISLLEHPNTKHDVLILKIFMEVLKKMNIDYEKVKFLNSTEPSFTYGKQVFFSYVPSSRSVEIYPQRLLKFMSYKKQNDFKGVADKTFINGFFNPVVIHSAAHELGHSINFEYNKFAKKNGWQWKEQKVTSKYLVSHRLKEKTLDKNFVDYKYAGLSYSEWLEQNKLYIKTINNYSQKYPGKKYFEKVKELKWYTPNDSNKREYQASFLVNRKIPSLYALSQPKEYAAELIASCIFQKFYPKSSKIEESIRFELTIGLNPSVAPKSFCQYF